jgi:hypothetical protein
VQYVATFNLLTVQEIGLKDSSGNLLCRGVLDSPVQTSQAGVSFEISDATEQNGVVTQTGQTAIRDIIADNNPQLPTRYALGSNQTTPTQADTSLSNQIQETRLDRILLQTADTATEIKNTIQSIPDDSPLTIDEINNAVTLDPVTYIGEAENQNFLGNLFPSTTLSNNDGVDLQGPNSNVTFEFTVNYDIQAFDLRVGIYAQLDNFSGTMEFSFDGSQYRTVTHNNVTEQNLATGGFSGVNDSLLEAGSTHTLNVSKTGGFSGDYIADTMFAFDESFNISPPTNSAFNGITYDFPELFPTDVAVSFDQFNRARRPITELEVFQSWNNTDNNAAVTLNLGSQSNTVTNPVRNNNGNIRETLSVSQSNAARSGSIDITLSRFNNTNTSNTVPRLGDAAQAVSFHLLDGNPDAISRSDIGEATTRTIFRSGVLSGNSTLRESGQIHGPTADLLTHSVFADIEPGNDTIIPVETIRFIPE